jgi:putative DNA primase/helicase
MSEHTPERLAAASHLRGVEHALDLAARGWPVVPYLDKPGGQQVPGWPTKATTDTESIVAMFEQYGSASYVGVVPGLVNRACIDIDRHPGRVDGFETLEALGLPTTAQVTGTSRSGLGQHLWYDGTGTSTAIYPGVDRKSIGGLVRVVYMLPDVEDVIERLPRVFEINNKNDQHREYRGSLDAWVAKYSGKPESGDTASAVADVPDPFTGHNAMLSIQTRLVKLAGEGAGGIPEALQALSLRWAGAPHQSGRAEQEWARGLAGAVVRYGGDLPEEEGRTLLPAEAFFDKSGLLVQKLAGYLSHDLAVGPDGRLWLYEGGVYRLADDELRRRHVRALGDRYRAGQDATVRNAVIDGQNLPRLRIEPDSNRINLRNGMLDWRTGTLEPHSPDALSTIQLPVTFDPDAECPQFSAWLAERVPADSLEMTWEAIGYALMSGNPYDTAILLRGPGSSGKSTFLNVLQHMLGRNNVSNLSLRAMSGRFEAAELYGKIANVCGDIDSKFLDDTSMFKQLTGRDEITAQRKFGHPFTFVSFAKPIFSANETWRTNDTSEGYLRRWVILSFPNKVARSVDFSEQPFFDEASGILNKAMDALRRLMARGQFEVSASSRELFEEFEQANDVLRTWLAESERATWDVGNESMRANRKELYENYRWWAMANGYAPKNAGEFYKGLRNIGFTGAVVNGTRYFKGIALEAEKLHWEGAAAQS